MANLNHWGAFDDEGSRLATVPEETSVSVNVFLSADRLDCRHDILNKANTTSTPCTVPVKRNNTCGPNLSIKAEAIKGPTTAPDA